MNDFVNLYLSCASSVAIIKKARLGWVLVSLLAVAGCVNLPEGIKPVNHFELSRYLGTWYEIARLDHSFERDLMRVTAEYSLQADGGVKVINRGFNPNSQQWDEAQGKAYFVTDEHVGHLKVSFFGPFYASYVIFVLDSQGYEYAMVTGPNRDYLWILARQPSLSAQRLNTLVSQAKRQGFDTRQLIYVKH